MPERVYSNGGYHRFKIGDVVQWDGRVGRVLSLSTEPSVRIEFVGGDRLDVGQSTVQHASLDCGHVHPREGWVCDSHAPGRHSMYRRELDDWYDWPLSDNWKGEW